ncbi:Bug family tripartite tricarboxylate transporter substrate binding protein [Hydrogenophaga sp. BPS33]|uniref:Bug family tripartite tricarboxylate transporter substrate binding protein n=1 Tax=Hydrogenophaga sp. BPS33 TaxID=2651974 RepID=UPI00135A92FE|nr:tripartite tricarboxylate transporter substrate binding protein [Hydrogenophaga sp. BPS33]
MRQLSNGRLAASLLTTSLLLATCAMAHAQNYPNKPIRMVVPFAPGGTTDGIARIVANKVSEHIGQPIVVDNRAGAGGNVGTDAVAKAAPDGYTIAMVGNSFTVNPALYATMPYKPSDLQPVAIAGRVPFIMVARPGAPYKTVQELLSHAKAHPGKVNYASGGSGTIGHLGAHWFAELAKVQMTHVPYRGGSQAMTDLIGGQVDIFFDTLITSTPFLESGKIQPLFVTTEKRLPHLPQVPTATEAGFADLSFYAWVGMVAPAQTPKAVVERLNREVNQALASQDVKDKLAALGAQPVGGSVAHATEFMARETKNWGAVVKASGAQAQ